jgi:oligopeptide/dipeptide ABC transporter ATP-binding protein
MDDALLSVRGLRIALHNQDGDAMPVDGVDFDVRPGGCLALVGESGCGKSLTAQSLLRLTQAPLRLAGGSMVWRGGESPVDLAALEADGPAMRRIRGKDIAMVFQEPMQSLSPVHTIGAQIGEALRIHCGLRGTARDARAMETLDQVGIPNPRACLHRYAFELSGGQRQRAMIAMALACKPKFLIADEPTTALDVTIQAQILDLLARLRRELGMAMLLITHDLGVVAETAEDLAVLYRGRVVEAGPTSAILAKPRHPYTEALLRSIPGLLVAPGGELATIPGSVPGPFARLPGCPFQPRCGHAVAGVCDQGGPPAFRPCGPGHQAACVLIPEGGA